jgi:hypothetical protein
VSPVKSRLVSNVSSVNFSFAGVDIQIDILFIYQTLDVFSVPLAVTALIPLPNGVVVSKDPTVSNRSLVGDSPPR